MPIELKILGQTIADMISKESKTPALALREESEYLEKDLDREIKIEFLKRKSEANKQYTQNREERKKYAGHIFRFTCCWAIAIFLILILSGWKTATSFDISDKVLITLISSTTVNFFGFFLLVVKYLFNPEQKNTSKANKQSKFNSKAKRKEKKGTKIKVEELQ